MKHIIKMTATFIFLLATTIAGHAGIFPVKTIEFEKVFINDQEHIKFKICDNECTYLGKFKNYPINLIKSQQTIEELQFNLSVFSPFVSFSKTTLEEQYTQMEVISDEYIEEEFHELTDEEFNKVFASLNLVIEKLDKKMAHRKRAGEIIKNFTPNVL